MPSCYLVDTIDMILVRSYRIEMFAILYSVYFRGLIAFTCYVLFMGKGMKSAFLLILDCFMLPIYILMEPYNGGFFNMEIFNFNVYLYFEIFYQLYVSAVAQFQSSRVVTSGLQRV